MGDSDFCGPGANQFIALYFKDCVPRDLVGFGVGLASIATWMVAQFPQLWRNFRTQSAEALSPWFLAEWLMGDTCNLVGCLLTGDQLVTQTYTAMYFICTDVCLIMQYIYYGTLQRRRERALLLRSARRRSGPREARNGASSSVANPGYRILACLALLCVWQLPGLGQQFLPSNVEEGHIMGRRLLKQGGSLLARHRHWARDVGQAIGWASSAFYLGSRVAQIVKNAARGSAEGLSLAMFACAMTANCLYGGGILLRSYDWATVLRSFPWLLGSLGTVCLDLCIFWQARRFPQRRQGRKAGEQQALLDMEAGE